jgi:hypothetical protein
VFHVSLHLSFKEERCFFLNTYRCMCFLCCCGCAFYAAGECQGAFSYLISIVSLSDLCVGELYVLLVLLFFIGLELVPDLVLGEVRVEVRNLLVV